MSLQEAQHAGRPAIAPFPEDWRSKYGLIYADPPWRFVSWGPSPSRSIHYERMDDAAIATLPVAEIAAPNAVLLLWVVNTRLQGALDVIKGWGFTYKTVAFTWVKMTEAGEPFMGMGYWTRQNQEMCLLATRGDGLERKDKGVSSVILSRRGEHSRKPVETYARIERLFGKDVRRCELFSRGSYPGFDSWGNQDGMFSAQLLLESAMDGAVA